MAEFTTAGDLVAQIRKKFGMRGDSSLSLESSIIPVANLGDLDTPPFHSKTGFSCGGSIASAGGFNSMMGVYADPAVVPANYRAVVRHFALASATAAAAVVQLGVIPFSAISPLVSQRPVNSWDSVPTPATGADRARPGITLVSANSFASLPVFDFPFTVVIPNNASPSAVFPGPYLISPGNMFICAVPLVNSGFTGGFYGDEYLLG